MNFDYNFNQLQKRAEVTFEAKRYVKKEHKCDLKIGYINIIDALWSSEHAFLSQWQ